MNILRSIDDFFFARRGAWPFGLLRIAWATVTLSYLLLQWHDITLYYSDAGFLPRELLPLITRTDWYFSLLTFSGAPLFAWSCYLALLAALLCTLLGIAPRLSTIFSFVLLASLHERDQMTLGGGDTVLRTLGFILMLAPGIEALSLSRLWKQYRSWKKSRTFLPAATMPAWPYRLLLWQMIVIYASSLWWKLLGTMWIDGTAVGATLHHPIYINWPYSVMNLLMPFAPAITWATLLWEGLWLLLLIPRPLLVRIPVLRTFPLKRFILLGGLFFHGSIEFFMNVGSFSFALLAGYMGLLDDTDRAWLKQFVDRRTVHPIVVLYDGSCRLCRRSAFALGLLDAFKHLRLVDFRNDAARKKVAPHLSESQLDLAMHILLPDSSVRTGFYAFRYVSWHLPTTWILAPFLYVPGISHLGRIIYAWVAQNRRKCMHDHC